MAKPVKSSLKKKTADLFTWILLTCLVQVCIYVRSVSVGILRKRRKMYNCTSDAKEICQANGDKNKQGDCACGGEVQHDSFSFEQLPRFLFQYRIS